MERRFCLYLYHNPFVSDKYYLSINDFTKNKTKFEYMTVLKSGYIFNDFIMFVCGK